MRVADVSRIRLFAYHVSNGVRVMQHWYPSIANESIDFLSFYILELSSGAWSLFRYFSFSNTFLNNDVATQAMRGIKDVAVIGALS